MTDFARRVTLEVSIDGYDVAGAFAPYLLDFSYKDNASGKSDDLQLTLHNRDGKFTGGWMPKKGMEIAASVICQNWEKQGEDLRLPCGSFKIDEVELSGPPDKITIKGVSASLSQGLRDTRKTRAWENVSLQTVVNQIAAENGLTPVYIGPEHRFERQDQRNESDISFINRIAGDFGMACKVHNGKLAVYDSEEAEGKDAVCEIPKTGGMYSPKSYSFKISSSDTGYDNAKVSYTDPKTGKTQTAEAQAAKVPPKKDGDPKTLSLNRRVENADQAIKLAQGKLHKANRKEQTANLEIMGNPGIAAGMNVNLAGFGIFSGKWSVKSASHKISGSGGYSTSLELSAPAPTKPGKTESFVSESGAGTSGEIFQAPGFDYETDYRNIPTKEEEENFDDLAARVNRFGTDLDKLILCLPDIALAKADRCWLKDDRKGWFYLSQMLAKWLSIKEGQKEISPFWIDFEWVISYRRAHTEYNDFLLPIGNPYVFSPKGKEKLREIVKRPDNPDVVNGTFTFITPQWEKWESNYFNMHKVGPLGFWPDGLMAALQGFTFRVLADGKISGNGEVKVGKLAIFVHDVFNFGKNNDQDFFDYLGLWSCTHKEFSLWPHDNSYFKLSNARMRAFGEKFQVGADFLVLSDPHIVDNLEELPYD